MKRIEILLVVAMVAWAVGCAQVIPNTDEKPAGETRAEGTWSGGFSTDSKTVGPLQVRIDNTGKVVAGIGGPVSVGVSDVKSGSLRTDGLLEIAFRNGSSFKSANARLSQDGSTISGSGTFRAPDGSSQTVFFTLYRQV